MSYEDKMYSTAIDILNRREDQLMHYGRKGMKWGKEIFGQENEKQSGGNWGNNAFTNAVNDPKYNPIKKAQLEKKKEELLTRPVRVERGAQPRGDQNTSQDMSGYDRALGEGKKVFTGTGYNQYGRPVEDRYLQKAKFEPGTVYANYKYDNTIEPHMSPGQRSDKQAAVNKYSQEYGSNNSTFTDEDRARGQAVRQQQAEERAEERNAEIAKYLDEQESLRPVREGKASAVLANYDNSSDEVVSRVPRSSTAFNKTFYDRPDYQISAGVNDDSRHRHDKDAAKTMNENRSKAEQSVKQKEAIAKYGNQQPEKNDEQKIAEKARGQYIREEQAAKRKAELDKKKQELLEKARKEREQRGNHQRITDPDQIGGTILPTKLNNANFTLTDPDHIYLARGKSIDRHGIEAPDMRKKNLSKYE